MKKDCWIPSPVPANVVRRSSFGDMVADGIVGKRCLTAQRLYGLIAESFLPEAEGLCPQTDLAIGFSPENPRYANVYAHAKETEARLYGYMKEGRRIEQLLLWEKDEVLEAQLLSINRGFMYQKKPTRENVVLLSARMSVSEKAYDVLWAHVQKGGTVVFLDVMPKDRRFGKLLFPQKNEEAALPWDTYFKKETPQKGNVVFVKTKGHVTRVIKAALDDVARGNVWIEDSNPVGCRIRYVHKEVNGKNIYLFYNADEEGHASQYVRLPYSTKLVAVDPKSGGTWLPEQQTYEKETWFKLWLAPEESLLYIEDGEELPLLFAEDYPKKTNWENLSGEAHIFGYGTMPTYCLAKDTKATLSMSRTWENYHLAITVVNEGGKLCIGLGEASLLIEQQEMCYTVGTHAYRMPIAFPVPAKRLYITLSGKKFCVVTDTGEQLSGEAPEKRVLSVQAEGKTTFHSMYAMKIK